MNNDYIVVHTLYLVAVLKSVIHKNLQKNGGGKNHNNIAIYLYIGWL